MFEYFSSKVRNIPTPLAGLALGIASIMWGWENFTHFGGIMQLTGACIAAVLLLGLFIKFIVYPTLLIQDLSHAVVGSVVPTFAMTLMVISATIGHYSLLFEVIVWSIAVLLHLIFFVVFMFHRIRNFAMEQMVPSWFVPPIGIIVACVAVPTIPSLICLSHVLQYFGMICYAVMLPIMLYRFIFHQNIPDGVKPTIAIMAAPASLSLAGYLTIETSPPALIIALLFGIAILMTLLVYVAFYHLLKLAFSPAISAFTFPMAIGATALYKLANYLRSLAIDEQYIKQVRLLADVELFVASLVIVYVALRYALHYRPEVKSLKCI